MINFKQMQLWINYKRIDDLFVFITVYIKRFTKLRRGFSVHNQQHNDIDSLVMKLKRYILKPKGNEHAYGHVTWIACMYITIYSVFESHTNRILREQRFSGPQHHQGELSNVIFLPFSHQMEIFQLEHVILSWCLTKSWLQQIFKSLDMLFWCTSNKMITSCHS